MVPLRSRLNGNYQAGAAAGATVIGAALNLLEARAQFDAPERAVDIRVAEHDGRLYLDLADQHWRAVAMGPDGWCVLGCPPRVVTLTLKDLPLHTLQDIYIAQYGVA